MAISRQMLTELLEPPDDERERLAAMLSGIEPNHAEQLTGELCEVADELCGEAGGVDRSWGIEIDRRAAHLLTTNARGLSRGEMLSLFRMDPVLARARLAEHLVVRK